MCDDKAAAHATRAPSPLLHACDDKAAASVPVAPAPLPARHRHKPSASLSSASLLSPRQAAAATLASTARTSLRSSLSTPLLAAASDSSLSLRCPHCCNAFDTCERIPLVLDKCGDSVCHACVELMIAFQSVGTFVKSPFTSCSSGGSVRMQRSASEPTAMHQQHTKWSIECAKCGRKTRIPAVLGIDALKKNTAVLDLLREREKPATCALCGSTEDDGLYNCDHCFSTLCQGCWDKVHILPAMRREHTKRPHGATVPRPARKCLRHGKHLDVFCVNDTTVMCSTCAFSGDHQGHELVPIEEYVHNAALQLVQMQQQLEEKKLKMTTAVGEIDLQIADINKVHDTFEAELSKESNQLQQYLQTRCQTLLGKSQAIRKFRLTRLNEQRCLLDILMKRINEMQGFSVQDQPALAVLSLMQSCISTAKQLDKREDSFLRPVESSATFIDLNSMKLEEAIKSFGEIAAGPAPGRMDPPTLVKATVNSITVRWCVLAASKTNPHFPVTHYLLCHRAAEGRMTECYSGSSTEFTLSGLEKGTKHNFAVCAVNAVYAGPYSDVVCFETPTKTAIEFVFHHAGDSNGFIYWLGTNRGTSPVFFNPQALGAARATWSECFAGAPENVLDPSFAGCNCTTNKSNSWWQVELRGLRLRSPTHYALRHDEHQSCALRDWSLEASADGGKTWSLLRRHARDETIHDQPNAWGHWLLNPQQTAQHEGFNVFRVTQTGKNAAGHELLVLAGLILFLLLFAIAGRLLLRPQHNSKREQPNCVAHGRRPHQRFCAAGGSPCARHLLRRRPERQCTPRCEQRHGGEQQQLAVQHCQRRQRRAQQHREHQRRLRLPERGQCRRAAAAHDAAGHGAPLEGGQRGEEQQRGAQRVAQPPAQRARPPQLQRWPHGRQHREARGAHLKALPGAGPQRRRGA
eukprot:TRINITY_DN3954_c0_g1_i13.p1 TRINITY_DN3954_c0_g1~~TRINITY_DN3954_c0_g1_i13.p1  ORF type:complete len:918 (+),score=179.47 TRINITY_DN3954_c0_g1_i13:218-2971(+)